MGGLIGLIWLGWWFAPPWPDTKLHLKNTGTNGSWHVVGDGELLVYLKSDQTPQKTYEWEPYHADVFELPSRRLRATISHTGGLGNMQISPNGRQLLCQNKSREWRLYDLSSGQLRGAIEGDKDAYPEWSPEGRFLK